MTFLSGWIGRVKITGRDREYRGLAPQMDVTDEFYSVNVNLRLSSRVASIVVRVELKIPTATNWRS